MRSLFYGMSEVVTVFICQVIRPPLSFYCDYVGWAYPSSVLYGYIFTGYCDRASLVFLSLPSPITITWESFAFPLPPPLSRFAPGFLRPGEYFADAPPDLSSFPPMAILVIVTASLVTICNIYHWLTAVDTTPLCCHRHAVFR